MKTSLCLILPAGVLLPLTLLAQPTANDDRIRVTNRAGGGPGGSVTGYYWGGSQLEDLLFPLNKIENEFVIGPNGLGSSDDLPDLYVTTADNKLVKIAPNGVPTVVATTGTSLNFPHNIAIDRDGNIYIANFGNGSVTKTTRIGQTQTYSTTVLVSGLSGPIGMAFDRAGNLYVSNSRNNTITRVTPAGMSSVFYSGSALSQPWGLAFDASGDLYVANSGNNTITKITPGGAATPVITGGLNSPRGLAFDSQGNLYVTNSGNNTLARIPPGGVATVISSSSLNEPTSIAITDKNNKPLPLPPAAPVTPPPEPGRITNMSIRSTAGTGAQTLIVGAVLGGAGTGGNKPLLVRGVGPALTAFGVPGALADPVLNVFAGTSVVATNDNWGGDAQVRAVGGAVGAFELAPTTSRDAALYAPALPARDYTIQITGAGGTTGVALAELYDATPAGSFTATTPQLVNVSARTQVGTGADILIAGFTLSGATARTVLIRAVGPTLTGFGVTGALADPQLALFSGTNRLQENNDWGAAANAAQVTATTTQLGTFHLGAGARDSAILTTLQPGSYTAQISGVGGTTGVALVEIYVVP